MTMYRFILLLQAIAVEFCAARYVLETSYTSANWFDQFSFFTSTDPTAGYVNYVDQNTATQNGYINTNNGLVYMGVDSTHVTNGSGRNSVRITSNAAYTYGLFALDVAHMPGGICGTWPAFWLLGPNWPNDGEIDIIEGVNDNANNAMTLHTSDGCTIANSAFTGTLTTSNCYNDAPGQSPNAGCDIQDPSTQSYGTGFNANKGGVFAMEWTSSAVSIWFFPRGTTPSDLQAGTPDPTSWKEPVARYQGTCNIPSHFESMQIVFNTDFCGDWAGEVWQYSSHCSSLADTCNDYVGQNPTAFTNAYWSINSLNVYQSSTPAANASYVGVSPAVHQSLQAPPLLTTPIAMGGGLPNSHGRTRSRKLRSLYGRTKG